MVAAESVRGRGGKSTDTRIKAAVLVVFGLPASCCL
jgi:hypothetical protein